MLGRLGFRTSYGQNVLKHSLEVAYICQVIADELGLDGTLARRAGCCTTSARRWTTRPKAGIRRSAWSS